MMKVVAVLLMFTALQGVARAEEPVAVEEAVADPDPQPVPEATTPVEQPASKATTAVEVELTNGITVKGTVLTTDALTWAAGQPLSFTPENGELTILPAPRIKNVRTQSTSLNTEKAVEQIAKVLVPKESSYVSPGGFKYANVGKSRHLYAPSSIGLEQGEGYFSQKLLFSAVAVGATDNVTLLAGTFTFFPPALTVFGGKVSAEIAPNVHIAAGGEIFLSGMEGITESLARVGFGGITLGHDDSQITISSGYMSLGYDEYGPSAVPVIVAGQVRIGDRSVMVTENWLVLPTEYDDQAVIASLAYRLLGGRADRRTANSTKWTTTGDPKFTWDFGFIFVSPELSEGLYGPIPWIDFAWHFGIPGR